MKETQIHQQDQTTTAATTTVTTSTTDSSTIQQQNDLGQNNDDENQKIIEIDDKNNLLEVEVPSVLPVDNNLLDDIGDNRKQQPENLPKDEDNLLVKSSLVSRDDNNDENIVDNKNIEEENVRTSRIQPKESGNDEISRRVSFPQKDCDLVTGYSEPVNPWASVKSVSNSNELTELYLESCKKHGTEPIDILLKHLPTIDLMSGDRVPLLNLHNHLLTANACETFEEILKRIQYCVIDVSSCGLDDASAAALFDIIEYYEAANELDISENRNILNRGWQACISMVKKSKALHVLSVRATALSDLNANNLGKAMMTSCLHTIKLEHCGLSGRPISSLCTALKRNTVLKELWLAYNDLTQHDAYNIGLLLKSNLYIQFLDVSNNFIEDSGVQYIIDALIEQTNKLNELNNKNTMMMMATGTAPPINVGVITTPITPTPSSYMSLEDRLRNELSLLAANSRKIETQLVKSQASDNLADSLGFEKIEIEPLKHVPSSGVCGSTGSGAGGGGCGGGRSKLEALLSNSSNESVPTMSVTSSTTPLVTIHENQSINNNEEDMERGEQTSGIHLTNDSDDHHHLELKPESVTVLNDVTENNVFIDSGGCGGALIEDGGGGGANVVGGGDVANENVLELSVIEEKDKCLKCDNENSIPCTTTTTAMASIPEALSSSSSPSSSTNSTSEDVTPTTPEPDINKNTDKPPKLNVIYETRSLSENSSSCCSSRDELINSSDTDCFDKSTESFDFNDGGGLLGVLPTPPLTPNTLVGSPVTVPASSTQSSSLAASHSQSFDETVFLEKIPCDGDTPTTTTMVTTEAPEPATTPEDYSKCDIEVQSLLPPPERSFSSDSLNSDTSIDSNDSKSSIKLAEAKFVKNGTLERQADKVSTEPSDPPSHQPTGLQVLIFWNNQITRHSSKSFSDLLAKTNSLEILNVGRNVLSNDFLGNIKNSLKTNTSVTNLGLQGAHLTCAGVKSLSEVIEFGGNSTMQRIDLRDNNIDLTGLTSLEEAMKSNKTVTRIDLDETPSKIIETSGNSTSDYSRLVNTIRSHCTRNEKPLVAAAEEVAPKPNMKKTRNFNISRKISLTCQSIRPVTVGATADPNLLDPKNKESAMTIKPLGRLRSPLPSPTPSPISSPIPSPSRNRFQVSKVLENICISPASSTSSIHSTPSSTSSSPSSSVGKSRFRVSKVVATKVVTNTPPTITPSQPIPTSCEPLVKLSSPSSLITDVIVHTPSDRSTNFSFNFEEGSRLVNMDGSCSSLSSVESLDRPFNNTSSSNDDSNLSDSTADTFEILSSTLKTEYTMPLSENIFSHQHHPSTVVLNVKKMDENNENTLTNTGLHNQKQQTDTLTPESKPPKLGGNHQTPRVRKTSFFSSAPTTPMAGQKDSGGGSGNGASGGGGGNIVEHEREPNYPPSIERLINLFRSHPAPNYNPPTESVPHVTTAVVPPTVVPLMTSVSNTSTPTRKDSSMSGFMAWMNPSSKKVVEEPPVQPQAVVLPPFKSNSSPSKIVSTVSPASADLVVTAAPKRVSSNQEMKENISPDMKRITFAQVLVSGRTREEEDKKFDKIQQPPPTVSVAVDAVLAKNEDKMKVDEEEEVHERVHFEVGGEEDEDDDEDFEEEEINSVRDLMTTTSPNYQVQNELSLNSKLGQIARDSLALLKCNDTSTNSLFEGIGGGGGNNDDGGNGGAGPSSSSSSQSRNPFK